MSPSKRINLNVTAILALAGVAAIVAAFSAGIQGWNPQAAVAAETEQTLLGLDQSELIDSEETSVATEKFEETSATAALGAAPSLIPATRIAVPSFKLAEKPKRKAKVNVRSWRRARVSWYGPGFYGNGMAGGGRLRRNSMVVAHRTMKFGTKLKIYYRGRMVTAVVKDRGPFVRGRTFDLGPGVAKKLKFSGVGTIRYKIVKR